jgi:hypothetical protein
MLTAGYRRFGIAYQVQKLGAVKCDNYTSIAPYSPSDEAIVRIDSEIRVCSKGKIKVNFSVEEVTKAQRGSRSIALHFL